MKAVAEQVKQEVRWWQNSSWRQVEQLEHKEKVQVVTEQVEQRENWEAVAEQMKQVEVTWLDSLLEAQELLQLQLPGRPLVLDKAVWVRLLRTLQLLAVFIHVLQHPATVGGGQLEPHLGSHDRG